MDKFVGYDSGREDGARNRLPAASKGRVHAWLDITRVAKGGQALLKVPDHVPFPDLTIRDRVPFSRHIVPVESSGCHSIWAVQCFYSTAVQCTAVTIQLYYKSILL